MFLSYKYRLLPNKAQHQALATISEGQRQLYNAALQERIDCYRKTGKTISYMSQSGSLTTIRKDDPAGYGALPVTLSRATLQKSIQRFVGIDVGLSAFAFQSDGIAIPAPQVARRAGRELRRRSRALARCKRGSCGRKKARKAIRRLHAKVSNTRRTWLHQLSTRITNSYDLIAVEDLNVAGMVQCRSFARSISDAAWATFTNMLSYKAEKAGGTFIKVDPKMTSQICSGCGDVVRKGLSDRVHNCPGCGLVLDRDHNAALNILRRAVLRPGTGNVTHVRGERRARNIKAVTS